MNITERTSIRRKVFYPCDQPDFNENPSTKNIMWTRKFMNPNKDSTLLYAHCSAQTLMSLLSAQLCSRPLLGKKLLSFKEHYRWKFKSRLFEYKARDYKPLYAELRRAYFLRVCKYFHCHHLGLVPRWFEYKACCKPWVLCIDVLGRLGPIHHGTKLNFT